MATFPFGKHRGKTFVEVAETDASYCDWALRQESPSGALKEFVDFLRARRGIPNTGAGPRHGVQRPGDSDKMFFATHRLSDDATLVCELLQEQQFQVRAEKAPGLANPFSSGPGAYMPPHIWGAIGALPGATLSLDRRAWVFPLSSYDVVARRLDELGTVERIPQWVLQMAGKVRHEGCSGLDAARLPEKLLPYQLEGVQFAASRGGRCLIGDEMGLGKTLQALALAAQYAEEWPVLVVCPSSLRWVWKDQAEEWLPGLVGGDDVQVIKKGADNFNPRAKFWIISYNLLATDMKKGKFQQRPDGSPHAIVIADESHNIKEWSAARTKAVVPLLRKAKRSVMLSGTPTRNSPDELHPQLCALLPSMPARYQDFRARYCMQQQSQLFNGRVVSKVVGARNAAELNYLLTSTVMVRRLKKDVLSQLPPKRRQRIPIEVSDARLMKDIRSEMQAINDVLGSGCDEAVSTLFMKTARAKLPAVKEYILEVLERGDEKAIIFGHHQIMLDEISELLDKQLAKSGLCHMRIDGRTPGAKRAEYVKKFQEDPACRIALLSITACGEGITLTAAGLVIFAELYWVPGALEQAEARAHRIGTTHNKVVVEFLVVPNSPDEHIYNRLERKKKDTSQVLDGAAESLQAVRQAPSERQRKRPGAEAIFGAGEAGSKRQATAPPGAESSPGPKSHEAEADETPPPVSRSKINFLLRALQNGATDNNAPK